MVSQRHVKEHISNVYWKPRSHRHHHCICTTTTIRIQSCWWGQHAQNKNGIQNLEAYGDEPNDLLNNHNSSCKIVRRCYWRGQQLSKQTSKIKNAKLCNSDETLGTSPMRGSSTTHDNSEQRVAFSISIQLVLSHQPTTPGG